MKRQLPVGRIVSCLLVTLLVTGTYVLNVRDQILSNIVARQWRALFLELAG